MLKNHCVSLEIAKKLKEARWKKETEFWWVNFGIKPEDSWQLSDAKHDIESEIVFPAPLATEILEELPDYIKDYDFYIIKDERGFLVGYCIDEEGREHIVLHQEKYPHQENPIPFINKSLPDALAKIWLYLKKNNLTQPQEE